MDKQKYKCRYKQCSISPLTAEDSRVEVCTFVAVIKKKDSFYINWTVKDDTSEAMFHTECWDVLLKSARARSKKNNVVALCSTETSMVREAAKTAEQHDSVKKMKAEATRISQMIEQAKHCVVFTGAGISTSAGIGDFRGKTGKWTEGDRKKITTEKNNSATNSSFSDEEDMDSDDDGDKEIPYEDLRPTYTHEALMKLIDRGHVKYVISQNCDGLHRLSGIPADKLSELHGNVFIEKCERCGQRYARAFEVCDDVGSAYYEDIQDQGYSSAKKPRHAVQCKTCQLTHRTGRVCEKQGCKGHLMDTIINFGDMLEDDILEAATQAATQSDVMLSLGSTMVVTPACDLVLMGEKPTRMIICNRQKTCMDSYCDEEDTVTGQSRGARVFGDCDRLLRHVMTQLLGEEQCKKWEGERQERMTQYAKLRK